MKLKALLLLLPTVTAAQAAETVQAAAEQVTPAAPLLSSEQVYNLLVYAIIGSLGALGLLLGLDRVIIMLVRSGAGQGFQKYSSETVTRILPIVIEGITVILVVLAIVILGVLGIVSAEGSLGKTSNCRCLCV